MGANMPAEIRASVRTIHHPARAVDCDHCGAAAHRPCRSQSKKRLMPEPHPSRISAWALLTACCPACQVEPGIPCHLDGRALFGGAVHPQRQDEARRAAA